MPVLDAHRLAGLLVSGHYVDNRHVDDRGCGTLPVLCGRKVRGKRNDQTDELCSSSY